MSGSISVSSLQPLVQHTSVPMQLPSSVSPVTGPTPGGTAFQGLLAGSPAPSVAVAPSPCIDGGALTRMAGLAPAASDLPVAAGPQAAGRTLAVADLSMAAWPASPAGAASASAASAVQVDAVRPVGHAAFAGTSRLLPFFP